jgi:PTS system beta-glucosides-specific IIC component
MTEESKPMVSLELKSPVSGETCDIHLVKDEAFSTEILGKSVAVIPGIGKISSPVDGVVETLPETYHAVFLESDGVELLIHIGIDTMKLKGRYFRARVKEGKHVSRGDTLIEFDITKIKKAGFDPVVVMVVANSDNFREITVSKTQNVTNGDTLMTVFR